MPRKAKSTPLPEDWQYEATLAQVETLVSQLESGDLPLAQVFEDFNQAAQLLQQCDRFLQQKQAQLTLLIETLEDDKG